MPPELTVAPTKGSPRTAAPEGPFRVCRGVLTAWALDAAALYDPATERYLTLNPVAASLWQLVGEGVSTTAMVERLCGAFEVAREQVENDVAQQILWFLHERLIETASASTSSTDPVVTPVTAPELPTAPGKRFREPSLLMCGLVTARIKRRLSSSRFQGALAWLRTTVGGIHAGEWASLPEIEALERKVATAAAFYPGRARCLEQSLALYYLARQQGIRVRYCQGVQLYPFEAHAWIEYRGKVINDVAEHVKHFARFPDQLP